MTLAEMIAQRRAWVIGEIMLSNPKLTRADAEAIYRSVTSDTCRKAAVPTDASAKEEN